MSNKQAIEEAKKMRDHAVDTIDINSKYDIGYIEALEDLITRLESLPQEQTGWISVNEKYPPQNSKEFLAIWNLQGNVQQIVRWDKIHSQWISKDRTVSMFQYWQPLQEPPLSTNK